MCHKVWLYVFYPNCQLLLQQVGPDFDTPFWWLLICICEWRKPSPTYEWWLFYTFFILSGKQSAFQFNSRSFCLSNNYFQFSTQRLFFRSMTLNNIVHSHQQLFANAIRLLTCTLHPSLQIILHLSWLFCLRTLLESDFHSINSLFEIIGDKIDTTDTSKRIDNSVVRIILVQFYWLFELFESLIILTIVQSDVS